MSSIWNSNCQACLRVPLIYLVDTLPSVVNPGRHEPNRAGIAFRRYRGDLLASLGCVRTPLSRS